MCICGSFFILTFHFSRFIKLSLIFLTEEPWARVDSFCLTLLADDLISLQVRRFLIKNYLLFQLTEYRASDLTCIVKTLF